MLELDEDDTVPVCPTPGCSGLKLQVVTAVNTYAEILYLNPNDCSVRSGRVVRTETRSFHDNPERFFCPSCKVYHDWDDIIRANPLANT
jgi:hypothetical protein